MKKMKLNIQLFSATCTVSVKSITQSIANNSSTITIHGKLSTDSSSYNYGGAYMQPIISNQPVIGTQTSSQTLSKYKYNIGKSSSKEDDWTFTVYHNNNGTCNNLTIQIKWYVSNSTNGTKTLTNGYTPDTIARASTVSASDGTLNVSNDVSISITRQDNSFTHTLRYVCGDDSGWIKDVNNKVSTSANWTPPLSLANQNKTGYSLSCKIYCQTYNGTTPIGDEKYDEITLTIPSLSPTATLGTVNDDTSYKSTYGAFIQNKSTIKVSLSGTPQYTDISSYSWEIRQNNSTGTKLKSNSGSYTGSLNISYIPTVSGTLYIKGTVTDKRGASHSTDTTVLVTAYSPPTCSLVVSRVNSTSASYTMSGTGTAISNAGYTANTLEFTLVRGSTTVRSTSNGAYYTGTDSIADQSYTYTLTAKDTISGTTDTKTVTIATTFTLMNFSASGKAMAIGKASEATGNNSLFEVAMDTDITGALGVSGNTTISGNTNANGNVFINSGFRGRGCIVGQSGSGNSNPFYKFAETSISNTYIDRNITFKVYTGYGDSANAVGILTAHVRTDGNGYWQSGELKWEYANSGIDTNKFIYWHNTSTNPTKIELYAKCENAYQCYHFDVLSEGTRDGRNPNLWTLINNTATNGGIASLPSGTWFYSTLSHINNEVTRASLGNIVEAYDGRITTPNINHYYSNGKAHMKLLIATSAMTSNKPNNDGFIVACNWDNDGQWNTQMFMPNATNRCPQFRVCANGTWTGWRDFQVAENLYNNATPVAYGTITLSESSANFQYIEIFYRARNDNNDNSYSDYRSGYRSVKVYQPDGKKVQMLLDYDNGSNWYHCFASWKFSGSSLIKQDETRWRVSPSTAAQTRTNTTSSDANIGIVRVVGYR